MAAVRSISLALAMSLLAVGCSSQISDQTSTTGTSPTSTTSSAPSTTIGDTSTTSTPPTTSTTLETTTTLGNDVIEIEVANGGVVGGPKTVQVPLGSVVAIRVLSDSADHVHVHGYDIFFNVSPGLVAEIELTANVPGIFEVELEDSHLLLLELEVS